MYTHIHTSIVWTRNCKNFIYRDMQTNVETAVACCLHIVLRGESYSLSFIEPRAVEKAERQSGLSNVQMSPLEIAANNSSLELQNSSYNLKPPNIEE